MKKQILASLILAAALVGYWFVSSRSDPPAEPTVGRENVEPIHRVGVEDLATGEPSVPPLGQTTTEMPTAPPPDLPSTLPPLPDRGLPLAKQLDALVQRASAGDPVAACRLIVKSSTCVARARSREFAARIEQSIVNSGSARNDDLMVRAIALNEQDRSSAQVACAEVDTGSIPSPDSYLERSAASLNVRQKVLLAMIRLDGSIARLPREGTLRVGTARGLDELVPQFFADHDLLFLREGYEAADPLALEGLILVHAPGRLPHSSLGMRIALPNPYQFALHAQLMERLFGPASLGLPVADLLSRTLAAMDPVTLDRLNREVEMRAQKWRAHPSTTMEPAAEIDEPDALCEEG